MNGTGFSLLAGGALLALIPSVWGYLKALYAQCAGRLVGRAVYRDSLADAVSYYLVHSTKSSRFCVREFAGAFAFIRPLLRRGLIAIESPGEEVRLYWLGWKPVLVCRQPGHKGDPNMVLANPLKVSFIRGTLDSGQLAILATEQYNAIRRVGSVGSRYFIRYMSGTDGELQVNTNNQYPSPVAGPPAENNAIFYGGQILQWKQDEIGDSEMPGVQMFRLALSEHVELELNRIEHWFQSEQWYRQRGIPWRRGCLFCGPPGTGKTATVRALAQKLDMPVFVFDLSTLRNRELRNAWSEARSCTPCIALFEDIDCVFEERRNIAGTSLTFDALLNCLDGVQESTGVLAIITTNCPKTIDPALGAVDGMGDSSRPGRIDCVVEFEALTKEGRIKLAQRILCDWPHMQDRIVADGDGETGAQFQERCCKMAAKLLFSHASNGNGKPRKQRKQRKPEMVEV